ncbi:MAG: DUF3300 domain-containing protein [Verrucomicrobia bacterium]|nr:DUF3300 domain-containing protein [Verrucomicrobiota bacterium]
MRLAVVLWALAWGGLGLGAQVPAPTAATTSEEGIPLRPPEELDELMGPIALYPDALIALILPASTFPGDIARAAAFLQANGPATQIAQQPWDASVQALAHYPEIVRWMNDNITWTQQTGDAFTVQPADVMKSIQQLRARAIAAGTLFSTAEQLVLTEGGEIRIVPARPEVIYVPRYDPVVVYDDYPSYTGSRIIFGTGFATGSWLAFDLNWDTFGIWVSPWQPRYDYRRPPWRRPLYGPPIVGRPWHPAYVPGRRPVWPVDPNRHRPPVFRPQPFPGAPPRPPGLPFRPPGSGPSNPPGPHRDAPVHRGPDPVVTRPNPRGYPPQRVEPGPAPTNPAPAPIPARRPRVDPTTAPRPEPSPTPPPATTPPPPAPDTSPRRPRPDDAERNHRRDARPGSDPAPTPLPNSNPTAEPARPAPARPSPAPRAPIVAPSAAPSSQPAAPSGNAFGGYNRGSDARDASQRGQTSRHTEPPAARPATPPPARPAPAPAPTPPPAAQPQDPNQPQTPPAQPPADRRRNARPN